MTFSNCVSITNSWGICVSSHGGGISLCQHGGLPGHGSNQQRNGDHSEVGQQVASLESRRKEGPLKKGRLSVHV